MLFDPALFAQVGRSIIRPSSLDKEARVRTAVGRAYYALFLAIRTEIRVQEGRPPHGRDDRIDHGNLKNSLASANNPDLNRLSEILSRAYEARRQADYVLEPTGRWNGYFTKPRNAEKLLRSVEAEIRNLRNIDFKEMAGKI